MDQYNKENYGVDWGKQLEEKKAQEKRNYEKKVEEQKAKEEQEKSAKEEKQKILATLADSRKSYEDADEVTKKIMVDTRMNKFNSNYDYQNPSDYFYEEQIKEIISTYGAENMQTLLDIVKNVYDKIGFHLSRNVKT
ncbi:MAG: hypothetical protein K6E76_05810 [Patescibacteria group bacterium]|nr:hypothetical protein [Patescibacteria group bacterium]